MSFFAEDQELVQVDFENRDIKELNDHRNAHFINKEPISVKVTSLCVLEQHFLNDDLITMNDEISYCFDGLRGSSLIKREINSDNIYKVLGAHAIRIEKGEYEQNCSLDTEEIEIEFGELLCINLTIDDCQSIGGSFSFQDSDVDDNDIVKGKIIQEEDVLLHFMTEETIKTGNQFLLELLSYIKEIFAKYKLDINAFHLITQNLYKLFVLIV